MPISMYEVEEQQMPESHDPKETLDVVRRLLKRIAALHPDVQVMADEIAAMVGTLVGASTTRTTQRRTGIGVKYKIELVNRRQMLYEVRPAGAPLRVSRDLFDALVGVLERSEKPSSYDEIAEGMEKATDMKLAEWQGRLLLRYFQRADPPLIIRERSRYRVVDVTRLKADAQRFWRATARS